MKKKTHVNAAVSSKIPEYAIHSDTHVSGFFGPYRFLSNFWTCPNGILYLETKFPSVEHAYQAAKLSMEVHSDIAKMTAAQAKKAGRLACISQDWDIYQKQVVMSVLVFTKFSTDDSLRNQLLITGDRILEERNSWGDQYWGVNADGLGRNELGKILMGVRSLLRC